MLLGIPSPIAVNDLLQCTVLQTELDQLLTYLILDIMKLRIISVHNHGDFDKEHVLLKADDDCDVGRFLLADSTYTKDGKVSNKLRHTFWFPDKQVKKGDLVSVWTRTGEDTTAKSENGTPIHRFYWNLKTAVWNDEGDCAVLLDLNTWQLFKASAESK